MKENQNIEYKESWRDENLKIVCAFANTHGGSLFIGISDNGSAVGVKNIKKLLEDIPNKVISNLGIIVDVQTHKKSGLEYIEVNVPQSSVPIAYRGIYYVKSGSTKQELKGVALQQFMLQKMGKTFDEQPADNAYLRHIDEKVVKRFLKKRWLLIEFRPVRNLMIFLPYF
jgi:ATP-dependent DNA helicase RecG